MERGDGPRVLVALLLVASAAVFGGGRLYERSLERGEEGVEESRSEAGEEGRWELGEVLGVNWETGEIFGMNSDADSLTVVGVVLTLLLALAVALIASRTLLWGVAVFGVGFVALDVGWELVRQIDKSRNSMVGVVVVVAVVHLLAAVAAIAALRAGQPERSS